MVAIAAKFRGFIFTPDAVATVKLLDLGMESEYQINRQGFRGPDFLGLELSFVIRFSRFPGAPGRARGR